MTLDEVKQIASDLPGELAELAVWAYKKGYNQGTLDTVTDLADVCNRVEQENAELRSILSEYYI